MWLLTRAPEPMTMSFQEFIEQLGKETRFNRIGLQRIYEKMIQNNYNKLIRYQGKFQTEWDNWVKANGPEKVSNFFVQQGDTLFREWLEDFFPFYTGKEQLILGFKEGGTSEDFIINIFYKFTQIELNSLNNFLILNRMSDLSLRIALTRVFLESFLAMRPIISTVVGYKYSLVVEESKFLTKSQGRILYLELIARPSE